MDYKTKNTSLSNHNAALSKSLDLFTTKNERLLFLGDFNAGMEDSSIKIFCSNYNVTSIISLLATKIQINLPVLI